MKWKDEYATGVEEVDRQHKSLFEFSETFRDVLENGFGDKTYDLFLEFIKTYAEVHFNFEEQCMLAHLCPAAERNCKEHVSFSRLVQEEEIEFRNRGFDRERALALTDMIDGWLDSHIVRIDVQLKDYVN